MSSTIYFPNLKKDGERPLATATKVTDSGEDHACLDVYVRSPSDASVAKAEDSVHVSGDTGMMVLGVRNDAGTLFAADGDYIPLSINSSGELRVTTAAGTEAATVADGGALPALTKVISGYDGAAVQVIKTDASGELQIDVLTLPAIPAGTNNIGDVDVLTLPALPAGTNNIGDVDVLTQPARSHATDSIKVGDGTDFLAISGTGAASVSVVDALPAGTNNIGDVDVLSLPGNLTGYAEDTAHSSGNIGIMPLGVRNDAGSLMAADGDYIPFSMNSSGELRVTTSAASNLDVVDFLDTPLHNAASVNIPASSSSPITVVASLAAAVKKIQTLDTTGAFIGLYSDPAGTPVLEAIIGPGSDTTIDVALSSSTVLGLRNMENSAITVGLFSINFIG